MTGTSAGASHPRTTRRSGGEPPGYERVSGALRTASRVLFACAALAAAAGGALLLIGLLEPAGGLASPLLFSAGGFLLAAALLPLTLAWRRRRRVRFLAALRHRWVQLARAGDPDDQIATLGRAYAGLVRNDLHARIGAAP